EKSMLGSRSLYAFSFSFRSHNLMCCCVYDAPEFRSARCTQLLVAGERTAKYTEKYQRWQPCGHGVTEGQVGDDGRHQAERESGVRKMLERARHERDKQCSGAQEFCYCQFNPEIVWKTQVDKSTFYHLIGEVVVRCEQHHDREQASRHPINYFLFHTHLNLEVTYSVNYHHYIS